MELASFSGVRVKLKEVTVIVTVSACIGLLFNFFWINRIPIVAPSKSEIYAQKDIPTLTLEETKQILDQGGVILLDARDAAEYEKRHIKGALNLPVRLFELYYPKMKKRLPRDAEIIVYCEGIECGASLHLSQELMRLKYESIRVFLGGWVEWNKAGYPAE